MVQSPLILQILEMLLTQEITVEKGEHAAHIMEEETDATLTIITGEAAADLTITTMATELDATTITTAIATEGEAHVVLQQAQMENLFL